MNTPRRETRRLMGARRSVLILIVGAASALAACPYSDDLPLAAPSEAVADSALPGTWKMQDPDTGQWMTMELARFSEKEYVAWSRDPSDAKSKVVLYRLFVTPIGDERFLNIQELGQGGDRSWTFANYRVSGDTLLVRFVDDALFSSQSFSSSDALRNFIRANLQDPRLYSGSDGTGSVMKWQRATD